MIIFRILKNKKGETIAETLVSTLIASLAMVMFAGMVIASKNIIEDSNKKTKEYYEGFSDLISIDGDKVEIIEEIDLGDGRKMPVYKNKITGLLYYEY